MATSNETYPVKFDVEYEESHDRLTSFARILWAIPAVILFSILTSAGNDFMHETSTKAASNGGGIAAGLSAATALMIIFRQRYPRWWFDFGLELNRFSARIGAYLFLLTDRYPSTVEKQSVRWDVDYPDAQKDLNRWLPIVKWLLAIPHYIVLAFLILGAIGASIIAWFAILFTGRYPKSLFDFVVGVGRWSARVDAYAFLLATDQYPPFSLK
jgi:hypothetical protein